MNTDRYTKAVLTIIALCLLVIASKNLALVPTAHAADTDKPNYAMVPLNEDGSMNVRVVDMPEEVDVNIVSCSGYAFSNAEPIQVKIRN
jgi:hypothetical protein